MAFISSPYKYTTEQELKLNVSIARAMCYYAMMQGYAPFASHLLYTQFLNEDIIEERNLGINLGREFLLYSEIMYHYEVSEHSEGATRDILLAEKYCIPVQILRFEHISEYIDRFDSPWTKY